MESIRCDLCDSNEPVAFATDNGYRLVRCGQCGLLYVNPRPSPEEIETIYQEWRCGGQTIATGRSQKIDAAAHRWSARRRLTRLLEHVAPPARLLEIGCGGGWFLQAAQEAGFEVEGIELSGELATHAHEMTGARVAGDSAEALDREPQSLGVVCHFNVLSHLRAPSRVFEMTARALRPGGWLYVLTGNRAELRSRDDGAFPGSDWGTPQHLFHYSETTLRRLLEKTGFEPVAIHRSPVLLNRLTPAYLRTCSRRWAGTVVKGLLWYVPPLRWALRAAVPLVFPQRLKIQDLEVVARRR